MQEYYEKLCKKFPEITFNTGSSLMSGNENTMAIVWLSLGSAFLCLGSTHKKKENNTDDK